MTVGERIKTYRKAGNMSQEQLAEKMMVSRQTISLWEKNQTYPTIENLIRLKDVFGVSVDDLLGEKRNEDTNEECLETLKFNYSPEEFKRIINLSSRSSLLRDIAAIVLLTLLIILVIITKANEVIKGIAVLAIACILIACIKYLVDLNITKRRAEERISSNTFEYRIYKDYMLLNILKNNEIHLSKRIAYKTISNVKDLGEYIIFVYEGQLYVIRKSQLQDSLVLKSVFLFAPVERVNSTKYKTISILFVILSITSFFVGLMVCIMNVSPSSKLDNNMWMMMLFLPVPIGSFVYGLFLKAKGYKYMKNIVVGLVISFLIMLCSTSVIQVG